MNETADQARTTTGYCRWEARLAKVRENRGPIQACRDGKSYVYFIGGDVGAIKIGVTIAPLERLAAMQTGSPIRLRILATVEGGAEIERSYHARFTEHRSHGEWFERHPDILAEIERLK